MRYPDGDGLTAQGRSRRAMTEADYAALITAAHRYLNAPLIVIWDNLTTHLSRKTRAFTIGHPDRSRP